jgi:hypothetical protein
LKLVVDPISDADFQPSDRFHPWNRPDYC